jgi:hypothetical protein
MCERCDELQNKIDRYRKFLRERFDPLTESRIKELVANLEGQKAAMH